MTIRESLNFLYDEIASTDMGVINVSTKSGMYEEIFLPKRSIVTQKIRSQYEPIFFGFDWETFKFPLELAFDTQYTKEHIERVSRWLLQDTFKPMQFCESLDRVFYCMCVDDSTLVHNGIREGYVTLNFVCDSPFSYVTAKEICRNLSINTSTTLIEINNTGSLMTRPKISIKKVGDGDIKIKNYSNKGEELILTGLKDGEELVLDCKKEHIESNLDNTYRFNNHNDNWCDLVIGKNRLDVTGTCHIRFVLDAPLLQG